MSEQLITTEEGADDQTTLLDELISSAVTRKRRTRDYPAERAARIASAEASGCAACIHGAHHSWWGDIAPARSHCRDCHRFWRSRVEAHCATCHAHFSTPNAFDAHLKASGCRPPAEVTRRDGQPKLRVTDSPYGPLWRLVNYRELPEFGTLGAETDGADD